MNNIKMFLMHDSVYSIKEIGISQEKLEELSGRDDRMNYPYLVSLVEVGRALIMQPLGSKF